MSSIFQPFEPDHHKSPRRRRQVSLRMVWPNLVSLLALCSGLTAIRFAFEGKLDFALYAIVLAAILDGIDGRVARLLKSTSRFGAELDSLMDFVNFGVAPAMILYIWTLSSIPAIGWIASLIFAICVALRLARFNAALDNPALPAWRKDYFIGIPAPAGALTVMLPIYLVYLGLPKLPGLSIFVLFFTLFIGLMMVSQVPTFSGKRIGRRLPHEFVLPLFILAVALIALLINYPFHMLAAGTIIYLLALPLGWRSYRHRAVKESSETEDPI